MEENSQAPIPSYVPALRETVIQASEQLLMMDEPAVSLKPSPHKWSPKEILGHLIDSAINNHRRFVLAVGQEDLIFDGYDQDRWVIHQQYQQARWEDLIYLWRLHNLRISEVMAVIPESVRIRKHAQHNLNRIAFHTVPESTPATLDYFMEDYVKHLQHHLAQILS